MRGSQHSFEANARLLCSQQKEYPKNSTTKELSKERETPQHLPDRPADRLDTGGALGGECGSQPFSEVVVVEESPGISQEPEDEEQGRSHVAWMKKRFQQRKQQGSLGESVYRRMDDESAHEKSSSGRRDSSQSGMLSK